MALLREWVTLQAENEAVEREVKEAHHKFMAPFKGWPGTAWASPNIVNPTAHLLLYDRPAGEPGMANARQNEAKRVQHL